MLTPRLRPATPDDLPVINAIYNHFVLHSTCTYQTVPATEEEREQWFDSRGEKHPVIVAELAGKVVAWASLNRFHPRQAYENTVENSIYVHHEHHGIGLGSLLLEELLRLGKDLGHHTMLGIIDGSQEPSMRLHEKFGFEEVGYMRELGFKFGRWLDVVYMQKML
jgi:phosphinothricin acetyltransferase